MNNLEGDYHLIGGTASVDTKFLDDTKIEIVGDLPGRAKPEHALFDFDGTLSLIREGWPNVMIRMMVEILQATDTTETTEKLQDIVEDFVMELTGKQTIYQMMRMAEEVTKRGGKPDEPLAYKQEYNNRLMLHIEDRRELLRNSGDVEAMLVPGSIAILESLKSRGVELYLASGTDQQFVKEEVALLGIDQFFGDNIHGALDDHRMFSKAMVIERILEENQMDSTSLVGFGDGYVEIQNIRDAGGVAIAVASDEAGRSGKPDEWKRNRLVGAGAHVVIPDFRETEQLIQFLFHSQLD